MNWQLLRTDSFVRAVKKFLRKHPDRAYEIQHVFEQLAEDAFQPGLKTHKLKGDMEGSWACSVGRDLRITFSFVVQEGKESVLLKSIGTHDEVY